MALCRGMTKMQNGSTWKKKADCAKALGIVLGIFETGALFRVVFGMHTLLDPNNRVVNPDSDTLELHPDIDRVQKQHNELHRDAMRYRYLRGRDLDAISHGGVFAGMTPVNVILAGDDLDAEIDAAMTLNVEPNETER